MTLISKARLHQRAVWLFMAISMELRIGEKIRARLTTTSACAQRLLQLGSLVIRLNLGAIEIIVVQSFCAYARSYLVCGVYLHYRCDFHAVFAGRQVLARLAATATA
jgi:hypothetical protein